MRTIKNYNTIMREVKAEYNVDLDVEGDIKLGDWLIKQGYPSLVKMLKK